MEFSLLGAAAIGLGSAYAVVYWEAKRGNAAECSRSVWDTLVTSAIVGLVVGRLAAMIIGGANPVQRPADILIVRGGVDTVWASLGAVAAFALLAKRELLLLADAAAAATLAGLAGWHAGCVLRDSCLGTPTDLPWGYSLPGSNISRHPVELYAAVLFLLAAVVMAAWRRRFPPIGTLAAAGLASAALIRGITESVRPVLGAGPGTWYALGSLVGAALLAGITSRALVR